jgi:putative ABC transport system permease protein
MNGWFEIVGVVSDVKNNGLREPVLPAAYVPYSLTQFDAFNVYLHTDGDPVALSNIISKKVLALDRSVIPQQTLTLDALLEIGDYAKPRFNLVLISAFASIGFLLVVIGVYSVSAYSVVQQQKEIGIRMALGAKPADVRSLVLGASLRFILLGVVIGLVCAAFTNRLLRSQIWGMSTYDPLTFCAVASLIVGVGLLASYVPSRRAAKVDPVICLRSE